MKRLKVKIKNRQKKITINKKDIEQLASQILKIKGKRRAELSILFAGTKYIRSLNKKFRKVDAATDVLAFSMREGKGAAFKPEILGDVVICPEIAQKSAKVYKTSVKGEIHLYLTHGILHLLGYDDSNSRNRSLMEREQVRILKTIKKNTTKTRNFGSTEKRPL